MTNKHTHSLAEVESQIGIPAEEIHARIWRGELTGDGNVAMPSDRRFGTVNTETFEKLHHEARIRRAGVVAHLHLAKAIHCDPC